MTPDEIIRALRENADWCDANEYEIPLCMGDNQREAADLIESLQAEVDDYHHMSELVDGKMAENQRLRRINENLQEQLAASQRREKAVLEDLHGYCKACINAPKTLTYDDLIKPICRECNKVVRQNWKWRGPQEAER